MGNWRLFPRDEWELSLVPTWGVVGWGPRLRDQSGQDTRARVLETLLVFQMSRQNILLSLSFRPYTTYWD